LIHYTKWCASFFGFSLTVQEYHVAFEQELIIIKSEVLGLMTESK